MNPLNRQWFYKGFHRRLADSLGKASADQVWRDAGEIFSGILAAQPELKRHKTIWNIFWSANNYEVPRTAPWLETRIQFWVGTDEWGSRYRDLKWTKQYLPQLEIVKIPQMMHGEFVMMHPEEFAQTAMEFLQ